MAQLAIGAAAPAARGAAAATAAPNPSVGLRIGAQGALVKALQQALINTGITLKGGADGSFGAATKAALVVLSERQRARRASGTVDEATAAKLGLGCRRRGAGRTRGIRQSVRRVEDRARRATRQGPPAGPDPDGSRAARRCRRFVRCRDAVGADPFQKTNGTRADRCAVGGQEAVDSRPHRIGRATAAGDLERVGYPVFGEHGDRVKTMQQSLIDAGIKVPGGADGVFGSSTAGAIMEFQRREGIPVTGKIDDQTAGRLGQAAAPAPVAPSASGIALRRSRCRASAGSVTRGRRRVVAGACTRASTSSPRRASRSTRSSTARSRKQYVDYPGSLSGNGLRVSLPNGTYFTYLHMSAFAEGLGVGVPVKAGQLIGYVGMTGNAATPHLHFEVHPGGGAAR